MRRWKRSFEYFMNVARLEMYEFKGAVVDDSLATSTEIEIHTSNAMKE